MLSVARWMTRTMPPATHGERPGRQLGLMLASPRGKARTADGIARVVVVDGDEAALVDRTLALIHGDGLHLRILRLKARSPHMRGLAHRYARSS